MKYDHKLVEKDLYKFWLNNKLFNPIPKKPGMKNFSILLPPPNVTGHLHLGHSWGTSIMDCIIRYKKIQGFRTCFIPGTDHAGISTQTKFEKILAAKGVNRNKLSDKEFLKQLDEWAQSQAAHIRTQWAGIGLSLAYPYETFTLDDNVNNLIFLEFKKLYEKGLIYQAYKLTNWDVKLQTAISDLETIKTETKGTMWYFKYYLDGSTKDFLTVATTRPETMFADTNLVINPKDKRYTKWLGKNFINPVNNEKLPLISDEKIEIDFGTGVMKCTPAHAMEDYEIAKTHKITNYKSCIALDGKLNQLANTSIFKLEGVDRIEARKPIVEKLKQLGLMIKEEERINNIGYSERSGAVVEPLLSLQWFVKMQPIVKDCKMLLKNHEPNYFPERFKKMMNDWLNKTQDWCISRQLLWGHRIPVWYHNTTKKIYVDTKPPKDIKNYTQDTSVLDTWFSSGLWPLATTKYGKTKAISDFYPIDCLVTGWDIIFFWVARMLYQCSFIDKTISLKNIILTGLIRASDGKKMSKSFNNGVDPDDMIAIYGADSLRATLISGSPNGEDLVFNEDKITYNRNFLNKLWNVNNLVSKVNKYDFKNLNDVDKGMLSKLNTFVSEYKKDMDKYNFCIGWKKLMDFAWESFANEYLEIAKNNRDNKQTSMVINYVYKQILIMVHPYMPFFSEYIYQEKYKNKKSIMLEKLNDIKISKANESMLDIAFDIIDRTKAARQNSSKKNDFEVQLKIVIKNKINQSVLSNILKQFNIILLGVSSKADPKIKQTSIGRYGTKIEFITIMTDVEQEIGKNKELLKKLELELKRSDAILSNENFLANASKEKIQIEKTKREDYKKHYDDVSLLLKELLK
ncbi:MAG: valine--tRNA ligase [Mycoplasmoidaceae bacterium]|nr:MAG: valine--tRNA ligase [Mycoplasmoidaceae bacterium]